MTETPSIIQNAIQHRQHELFSLEQLPVDASQQRSTVLQPPLKWAGGKRWLVSSLEALWLPHQHRRLVEPFCGGLAVTFGLLPKRALLNDINPHLINFYKHLQQGLEITVPMQYDKAMYYAHRDRFNKLIRNGQSNSAEAAQLFYYLNRSGYNGLCRFNRKGEFNVPIGKYKTVNYVDNFLPYRELLSRWDFHTGDFESLPIAPDDFVYADPPYDVEFVNYSKEGFNWDDQVRLAKWLAKHPGPVVLSNQAEDRVKELYESLGFEVHLLKSPRRISSSGDRTPALEVLAVKGIGAYGMNRQTRTGGVLEAMVLPSLKHGGYSYKTSVDIGSRPGGGRHKIDVLAQKGERQFLISLKWQQTSGTAEQKVPFEIICLLDAIETSNVKYDKAYVVLGGHGWKLRDFYIRGGLSKYLKYDQQVVVLDLEDFVARVNKGQL